MVALHCTYIIPSSQIILNNELSTLPWNANVVLFLFRLLLAAYDRRPNVTAIEGITPNGNFSPGNTVCSRK